MAGQSSVWRHLGPPHIHIGSKRLLRFGFTGEREAFAPFRSGNRAKIMCHFETHRVWIWGLGLFWTLHDSNKLFWISSINSGENVLIRFPVFPLLTRNCGFRAELCSFYISFDSTMIKKEFNRSVIWNSIKSMCRKIHWHIVQHIVVKTARVTDEFQGMLK